MTTYRGYIGTYTKGESKGVYSFTLDSNNYKVSDISPVAELKDPTYVAISDNDEMIYAVMKEDSAGGISAYHINKQTGELSFVNKAITADGGPCHITINTDQTKALSANYHSGMITAFTLNSNGSIYEISSTAQHVGSGPNDERQEKAHAHFSGFTPEENYAVAVDLGTDEVILYTLEQGQLHSHYTYHAPPGSGPRHIAFHPHELYAYIMTELSNQVIVCHYNADLGELRELQLISTLPEGFVEHSQGSAIHLSKDGKFVYAGNRGNDSIACFSVNEHSGELELLEIVSTEGSWPRDFQIDPSGSILLASNQESSTLTVFSRNKETGRLTLQEAHIDVPYPVCVTFLTEPI
ncbi:LOW QUALITY PROTEIN: 6-phosphogluconolactonase [Bacillus sp. JCM 19045]|nr:LOW QUALITY PROTEIN: 6-phosphogluconolactonase [Bacillus sp. JCM 19045]